MRKLFFFFLCLLATQRAHATTYFVMAGGAGTCSGADWNNAAGKIPATLNAGDIVYLGGSATGNLALVSNTPCAGERTHTFNNTGTSGNHIQIVKCTASISACTSAAGWTASLGTNPALWYDPSTSYTVSPGPFFWVICGSYFDILGSYGTADTAGTYGIIHRYPGRMDNILITNDGSACPLANYGNITFQYFEVDGVNPNSTHNGGNPGAGSFDIKNVNTANTMGPFTFDHIFNHDIASGFGNVVGITGMTISNSYVYRNFVDPLEHSNGMNCNAIGLKSTNLCMTNFTMFNTIFKDITGTGVLTCLNGLCSNWNVYNNLFYDNDSWGTTTACQYGDSTAHCSVAAGVISDNNRSGLFSGTLNFTGNTIYNLSSPINEACQAGISVLNVNTTVTATVENNLWYNPPAGTSHLCNFWISTPYGTWTHDYNQFINTPQYFTCPFGTPQNCQDAIHTHEFKTQTPVALPFVRTSMGNFQLSSVGTSVPRGCTPGRNCVANGVSLSSPYNVDIIGTARGGSNGWTMGAYQISARHP